MSYDVVALGETMLALAPGPGETLQGAAGRRARRRGDRLGDPVEHVPVAALREVGHAFDELPQATSRQPPVGRLA